jgi:hypothetical protein
MAESVDARTDFSSTQSEPALHVQRTVSPVLDLRLLAKRAERMLLWWLVPASVTLDSALTQMETVFQSLATTPVDLAVDRIAINARPANQTQS